MTTHRPLDGTIVTELGGREAVAICGSLLAQLGATVIVVEPAGHARPRDARRAQFTAGKLSLAFDPGAAADQATLAALIARSDVLVVSSDMDPAPLQVATAQPSNVVCDITAFASGGHHGDAALSEYQLQAVSGLMETTGMPDGPPVPIGVPVIGYSAAAYAASGVVAALRVRRQQGFGQRVEVAMFDAAFVALSNFLMGTLSGRTTNRSRTGNRHPGIAPWALYETSDGRVLIAAGSQAHWQRLCRLMNRPDVAAAYPTQGDRLKSVDQVDAAIETWTRTLTTAACVEQLVAAGVAAGPIAPIIDHPRETNLDFRGMFRTLHDPVSARDLFVPSSPLALRGTPPAHPAAIPAPGEGRAAIERIASQLPLSRGHVRPPAAPDRPLKGIRVVEVAQYTTAPLCARHLAHLGAEVIKIEKPGGDESRSYEPRAGQRSEAYCFNNADKRSIVLDLQKAAAIEVLVSLLRTADVLIENNKPGTLARFGLPAAALADINPRLVYCAISGFGSESLYGERPGFDTVIQAMSGFMSAVNPDGVPLKSGISSADLMGAQLGLFSILGALEARDRSGHGQTIDLSMQDIGCWLTATTWNHDLHALRRPGVLRCTDGYVLVDTDRKSLTADLASHGLSPETLATLKRANAVARLVALGYSAAPVNTIDEVCALPEVQERRLLFTLPAEGRDWPMLALPLRLSETPPQINAQAPVLDADGAAVLAELGFPADFLA